MGRRFLVKKNITAMDELVIRNNILIEAPAEKVWEALTAPEMTKKYMYGCEAISDWKIGSELVWKGVFDGTEMVAVKGNVTALEKDRLLSYTAFDPNGTIPDIPENYTTVTYRLSPQDGKTMLEVTQGDFANVADGERRYKDATADGGWQPILEAIRSLAQDVS